MCGRFVLTATPEEVRALFRYAEQPNFPPRFNIAPTQPIAIVTGPGAAPKFLLARWGFLPGWVADPKAFSLIINARAETAATKPSFRAAMRHRRCLVPASGFYEWRRTPAGKQPFFIRPRHGGLTAFAGLWETWSSKDGSEIDTACILTVPANRAIAAIHDRMPAVVGPQHHAAWIDTMHVDVAEAMRLIAPVADDYFEAVPVSERVNKVVNDDERLLLPLTEPLLPPAAPPHETAAEARERTQAPDPAGPAGVPKPARRAAPRKKAAGGKAAGGQLDLL
ncbi:SOS response-associated peptidase [Prosthecodimorpha staleyi]|uniref:Abasic site processing protein n=1 Tax=Prosthecodimorpha staleyi TaxID=2840188 RepID=A0A947GI26_9HYPH|nr:SOS response-associated peptidase [Prosthecodimorpha staleyi]MBT9288634.1 SOS response-associated peptidase [Prosthecodimorpha staleyi]